MSSKLVYGSIAIAGLFVLIGLLLVYAPVKTTTECIDFDGFCPQGCTYETDADCPQQQLVQPGAIFSCIKDDDCIIADSICNNEDCVYFDTKCIYRTSCNVAISKNYQKVWTLNNTQCFGTKPQLNCPGRSTLKTKCTKGVCQIY